ncbi:hypothetical protein, partial [Stenotrophomonas sp. PSU_St103]
MPTLVGAVRKSRNRERYRCAEQRSAPTENAACKGGIFVPAAWLSVDADLGRRRSEKPQPGALSVCRATLGTYRKCRLQGRHFRSGC